LVFVLSSYFFVVVFCLIDFPYRDWNLNSTVHENRYILTLSGSRFDVQIEIEKGHTRLLQPRSPVLEQLNKNWYLPGQLFSAMCHAGINVQPTLEDAIYCRKPIKLTKLTSILHEHIALVSSVFEIGACSFNSSHGQDMCLFQVRINPNSLTLIQGAQERAKLDAAEHDANELLKKQSIENGTYVEPVEIVVPPIESSELHDDGYVSDSDSDTRAHTEDTPEYKAEQEALRLKNEQEAERIEQQRLDELAAERTAQLERNKLGLQWHTVEVSLASLDDTPEGLNAIVPPSTCAENVPGGSSLLKFVLLDSKPGIGEYEFEQVILSGCVSHVSLRRCLYDYFHNKTEHDLTTALSMVRLSHTNEPGFLPANQLKLQTQQTLRRTLNLANVFTFH
jgi:hypothetical protein